MPEQRDQQADVEQAVEAALGEAACASASSRS
jgi:hypothetical protein